MKKFFTKEVKIGLSVILSLVILYVGIQFLKGINVMKPANHYYVTFSNVKDLMISSPVTVEGFKVGLVHEMQYDYETNKGVRVMLNLDKELRIPKGSKIILSKSLLGNASLIIEMNPYVSEYYNSGDEIEGMVESEMLSNVSAMIPKIEALVPKLDSILTGVQALVNDPALAASIGRLDNITADLAASSQSLSRVMRNDVPAVLSTANTVLCRVDTFATTLNSLPLQNTVASVNSIAGNLELTTARLNGTDNTLGLLLNDRYLYDRLTGTVGSLDSLLIDLRLHPKRYLHFSVF